MYLQINYRGLGDVEIRASDEFVKHVYDEILKASTGPDDTIHINLPGSASLVSLNLARFIGVRVLSDEGEQVFAINRGVAMAAGESTA